MKYSDIIYSLWNNSEMKDVYINESSILSDMDNYILSNKKNFAFQVLLQQRMVSNIKYMIERYRFNTYYLNEFFVIKQEINKKELKKFLFLNKKVYKKQIEDIYEENYKLLFITFGLLLRKEIVIEESQLDNSASNFKLKTITDKNLLISKYEKLLNEVTGE